MRPIPQHRRPLLATATEAFAVRGYAGVSVDCLLEATGLDPAAFRRRFTDGEGCFLAAYDRIVAVAQAHLTVSLSSDRSWPSRVAAAVDSFVVAGAAFGLRQQLIRAAARDLYAELLHFLLLPYLGEPRTTDFVSGCPAPRPPQGSSA
jgi:AcrR family transcriptional regulator